MAKFPGTSEVRASVKAPTRVHFEIAYTDNGATYTVPVKAGMFVDKVVTVVKTAFNATSPSLIVGDGDNTSGFLANSDVALATAATGSTPAIKDSSKLSNAFAAGKYYAADDTIDFTFAPGTGGTAGVLKGFVQLSSVRNDGVDA